MWGHFLTIMNKAVELYVSKCKNRVKKYPLWMDKKAKKAHKKKSKKRNKYFLSQSSLDKSIYNRACNMATTACRNVKINYEKSLANDIKTNSKQFYAYIRSKSKVKDSISCIKNKDGTVLTEDSKICEELYDYFSSVCTKENSAPPLFKARYKGSEGDILKD